MHFAIPSELSIDKQNYRFPLMSEPWLSGKGKAIRQRNGGLRRAKAKLNDWLNQYALEWPKRDVVFISDLHADASALAASLVSSGRVVLKDAKRFKFELVSGAQKTLFIFGGDFFDKGPSNLSLLRALKNFIDTGAKVRLLAGNHDIRVLFGMNQAGKTDDPLNGHFFVRMGAKAIPFLKEIDTNYFADKPLEHCTKADKKALMQLLPQDNWWHTFPNEAQFIMPQQALQRELRKIKQKSEHFVTACWEQNFPLSAALRAAKKWQELFLTKEGDFYWFYRKMRLASRQGSFLFLHAGFDDKAAEILHEHGINRVNKLFRNLLKKSAFEFYYGSIANVIRTKYRVVDKPLSKRGASLLHDCGVHVLVHGHRNLHHGQRIAIRKDMLHFECDVTMDSGSRKKEGLFGGGAGATVISQQKSILGISTDYPKFKVFEPCKFLRKEE